MVSCCVITEGYGLTESSVGITHTTAFERESGHVGYVTKNCEFKLVDVPEMNYTSEDKDENGNLAPRGEICLRGPCIFVGYYKDGRFLGVIVRGEN